MQQSAADYTQLGDPDLFEERHHVREKLECLPESHPDRTRLATELDALTNEFNRRARTAWQQDKTTRQT